MAKTTQQVAKVEDVEEKQPDAAEERKAPLLKPSVLELQSEGYVWREFLCRLPAEAILQDLNEPSIWKAIQGAPQKSLRALDRVTLLAYDGSFIVRDVLVSEADSQSVKLAIRPGDVIRTASKSATWQDERHVIKWAGSGFAVYRRSDDVQLIPMTFGSVEAAKAVMYKDLYPRKVA